LPNQFLPLKVRYLFDLLYYYGYDERVHCSKALLLLLRTKETINIVAFNECIWHSVGKFLEKLEKKTCLTVIYTLTTIKVIRWLTSDYICVLYYVNNYLILVYTMEMNEFGNTNYMLSCILMFI